MQTPPDWHDRRRLELILIMLVPVCGQRDRTCFAVPVSNIHCYFIPPLPQLAESLRRFPTCLSAVTRNRRAVELQIASARVVHTTLSLDIYINAFIDSRFDSSRL